MTTDTSRPLMMFIDSSRCIDCKACLTSCKVANKVPEGQWRNWIKSHHGVCDAADTNTTQHSSHYQPGGCMQCNQAPCLPACPTGATFKDTETGVVLIDSGLCIGCGNCITACPYGARFRHAVANTADKCDYCAERRAQGLLPACVDTCPTKARTFGYKDEAEVEMNNRIHNEGAKPIQQYIAVEPKNRQTRPHLVYINHTAPTEWPALAEQPLSMQVMTGWPGKGLYGMIAASGVGVLAMGFTQLLERKNKRREGAGSTENESQRTSADCASSANKPEDSHDNS